MATAQDFRRVALAADDAGLVGLIALGVILWLFSSRKMA